MSKPITVSDALRLIELAREMDGKATRGPWRYLDYGVIRGGAWQEYVNGKSDSQLALFMLPNEDNSNTSRDANAQACVLWRASYGALLEYLGHQIVASPPHRLISPASPWAEALAALVSWAAANHPNWRSPR